MNTWSRRVPGRSSTGRGTPGIAARAARDRGPVLRHHDDQLAEAEGHDREVVAREPQRGDAEDDAPERGVRRRRRRRGPEAPRVLLHQDRRRVRADQHEAGKAEVQQAAVTHDDVEPQRRDRVRRDQDQHIHHHGQGGLAERRAQHMRQRHARNEAHGAHHHAPALLRHPRYARPGHGAHALFADALPSRPVGLKTMTSIMNAYATPSRYWPGLP